MNIYNGYAVLLFYPIIRILQILFSGQVMLKPGDGEFKKSANPARTTEYLIRNMRCRVVINSIE